MLILDPGASDIASSIRLASEARGRDIPVVCLVELGQDNVKQALMDCSGNSTVFLQKPVNRRELLKLLAEPRSAAPPPVVSAAPALPGSSPQPQAAPSGPQPGTLASDYPARILLVEDQPMNQKLGRLMLTKLGYGNVDLAENGVEAVEKICGGGYDVVFMDLHMPVMGGLDATRAVRKEFQIRQPIIVALTGDMVSGVKENCRECGMDDFLSKPVSLDDLKGVIIRNLTGTATTKVL